MSNRNLSSYSTSSSTTVITQLQPRALHTRLITRTRTNHFPTSVYSSLQPHHYLVLFFTPDHTQSLYTTFLIIHAYNHISHSTNSNYCTTISGLRIQEFKNSYILACLLLPPLVLSTSIVIFILYNDERQPPIVPFDKNLPYHSPSIVE